MDEMLRIGVVGLNFGMNLVRTVAHLPGARVAAICDLGCPEDKLRETAERYGAAAFRDAGEMVEAASLDALLVCTSPGLREPLMRLAIERGLGLWVEKPFASDAAHAARLADLCRDAEVPVMVGFSFRFHPVVQRLLELTGGDLGRPWLIHASYVFSYWPGADWWLWKPDSGNGLFNENSCHLIDVVCAIAGEPVSVFAETARCGDSPGDNAASVAIRFESGAIANLALGGVGTRSLDRFPTLTAYTERGQAILRGTQHMWVELEWAARNDATASIVHQQPELLQQTRYTAALQHFCQCVRDRTPPASSVADGVRAVLVADAIRLSAQANRPIRLDELNPERQP